MNRVILEHSPAPPIACLKKNKVSVVAVASRMADGDLVTEAHAMTQLAECILAKAQQGSRWRSKYGRCLNTGCGENCLHMEDQTQDMEETGGGCQPPRFNNTKKKKGYCALPYSSVSSPSTSKSASLSCVSLLLHMIKPEPEE